MKVTPDIFVVGEGETQTDVFEQLASLQEVFGAVEKCGVCGCSNVRLVVRKVDGNSFYEAHCQNGGTKEKQWKDACRARLSFGQNKDDKKGMLYPRDKENKKKTVMKGKLKPGDYLPNGGWLRWNKDREEHY